MRSHLASLPNSLVKMNFIINLEGIDLESDDRNEALGKIIERARASYEYREKMIDPRILRQIERFEMLKAVDSEWMHHLHAMDYLREGIQLRAYGQKDPLLEYKHEAHKLFFDMEETVRGKTLEALFRIQAVRRETEEAVPAPRIRELIHS